MAKMMILAVLLRAKWKCYIRSVHFLKKSRTRLQISAQEYIPKWNLPLLNAGNHNGVVPSQWRGKSKLEE